MPDRGPSPVRNEYLTGTAVAGVSGLSSWGRWAAEARSHPEVAGATRLELGVWGPSCQEGAGARYYYYVLFISLYELRKTYAQMGNNRYVFHLFWKMSGPNN